ncbi:beta-1,3-galactosyltransferase brn-like [Trichoplusia ni]|uniref:Hexosyltransferase n=1 Tax=Trichoplusia ni TaxID=7111 RepID=A0A7E5VAS8_TRINI|nr:beta-1,3-galactosyltransferase brn-like [Trichoplusia ni]
MNLNQISIILQNNKMKRRNYKYFVCACVLVYIYYFFGVSDYLFSKSFEDDFDYPLNVDIRSIVSDVMLGKKISVTPINYYPYRFLTNSGKCSTIEKLDLFIVVKSSMDHFGHRNAIRQTYGQETLPGRTVKTLFFLGIDGQPKSDLQRRIDQEMAEYKDIIQIDFRDHYYNNTIKTMMSFRWVYEHCSTSDFYLFTDDDMYISVRNLLDYVHERDEASQTEANPSKETNEVESSGVTRTADLDKDQLFAGYVFKSAPQRFRSSKWRVSLDEYRWNKWPAYVTAGAYVLSNKSMKVMYIASLFVKHFRFDDIYLGIVAKKVGVTPTHCPNFYFYKKAYSKLNYKDVIASHGYGNHEELIRVWNEQNTVV